MAQIEPLQKRLLRQEHMKRLLKNNKYNRKLKIFVDGFSDSKIFSGFDSHSLPFDLEADFFEIKSDITKCDFIPYMSNTGSYPFGDFVEMYKKYADGKPVLIFSITHICEDKKLYYEQLYSAWKTSGIHNVHLITTDICAEQNHKFAHNYEMLWNRQKAYFYDYDKHVKDSSLQGKQDISRLWSYSASKSMYELPDIVSLDINNAHTYKKFLSPNRVTSDYLHTRRGLYRVLFSDYVLDIPDAYTSDWVFRRILEPQESIKNFDVVDDFKGWWPVANHYYSSSILSAYVETIVTYTDIRTVTEKTFDPLIKGHFILPFGYCGIVADIKNYYGFFLPDWIDYSYDTETDEVKRFHLFTKELLRLRNDYTIEELIHLRNRDIDILHRNRQIFQEQPYYSLYQIVANIVYN